MGFEDGGRGSWNKECKEALDTGKEKKPNYPLKHTEKNRTLATRF